MNNFVPELSDEDKIAQKLADTKLIAHIQKLFEKCSDNDRIERFKKYAQYYAGKFDKTKYLWNNYNIIQPIVETKTTLILDSNIQTQVVPSVLSFSDLDRISEYADIADIINDCLNGVKKENTFNLFKSKWVRDSRQFGCGIAAVYWDAELSRGQGNVRLEIIDPQSFYIDPAAKTIQEANFIFIKKKYSSLTLKKKYPEMLEKIDELARGSNTDIQGKDYSSKNPRDASGVMTYQTGQSTGQMFVWDGTAGIQNIANSIEVIECYLKDDSSFIPDKSTSEKDKEFSVEQILNYPYGRKIIYSGKDTIFEDGPIDYPFGFPFIALNATETDNFWGQGDIEPLTEIQDRINRAYFRIRDLVTNFISLILIDESSGLSKTTPIKNTFATYVAPGCLSREVVKHVTNNTINELEMLLKYIEELKKDAKEISRVNDTIISGQRPVGANSGQMIEDLNQSPLTAIRASQESFKEALIEMSKMAVTIIQLYYKTPRIIRLSNGAYASISAGNEKMPGNIRIKSMADDGNQKILQDVKTIQSDLSLGEYEVEITSGSELAHSRSAISQLTMQLAAQGYLGDPSSIDTKEIVLRSLDYPNYRAIVEMMKDKKAEQDSLPDPLPGSLVDKLSLSYKDLPPFAQMQVLQDLGINIGPEDGSQFQAQPVITSS